MPVFPKDPIKWTQVARPIVDGQYRNLDWLPFWVDIYNDHHWDVMVMAGRQVFKSTYCTDMLAWYATTNPGQQVGYAVDSGDHLSAFSNQRMRVGTFEENELLALFPRHGTGNIGEISLKNKATIYMQHTTEGSHYKKMEGKSPKLMMLDEAQYQPVQHLGKLESAMTMTHGLMRVLGIGGEAGSAYERMWLRTDQREWEYSNPYWRKELQFDENGLVIGDYLTEVLRGRWLPKHPENTEFHGYHIPQTMMPHIPLTIDDAVKKYHIAPKFSLEWKQKNMPKSEFITHVLGEFWKSARRPITREMVIACMEPYSGLEMMTGEEVRELKKGYGNELLVCFGADWGSSPSKSATVFTIMLYWKKFDIYQIAKIDVRPQENLFRQAQQATEMFKEYGCEIGVADLGYGTHQVKQMQDGGYDKDSGEKFEGVGTDKLLGCNSVSSPKAPFKWFDVKTDAHGDEVSSISIDKSAAIDEFIDILETIKEHPTTHYAPRGSRPQLVIPYKNPYETDFLIEDCTATTRKDLAEVEDIETTDPRLFAKKDYNHPRDTMMSIIYSIQAASKHKSSKWEWVSG